MRDSTSLIKVDLVEAVVQQEWFTRALLDDEYDATLVLAHMDWHDRLVTVLQNAIREKVGAHMPLVFATGHTLYRGFKQLDDLAVSFEAGRYP